MRPILILLFFALSNILISQNFTPFPTSNAVWNYSNTGHNIGAGANQCLEYSYFFGSDSMINGQNYHRLMVNRINYYNDFRTSGCTDSIWYTDSYTAIFFRNDISNRKVFAFDLTMAKDTIWYDFNIQVGDTIQSSYAYNPANDPIQLHCDTIVTLSLGGVSRRVYSYSYYPIGSPSIYPNGINLIEGIGWQDGLIQNMHNSITTGTSQLLCFAENNTFYPPNTNNCSILTSLEKSSITEDVSVYPNPAMDKVKINSPHQLKTVFIFDAKGRRVEKVNFNPMINEIMISELNNGLYLLRIETSNGDTFKEKLIKK